MCPRPGDNGGRMGLAGKRRGVKTLEAWYIQNGGDVRIFSFLFCLHLTLLLDPPIDSPLFKRQFIQAQPDLAA